MIFFTIKEMKKNEKNDKFLFTFKLNLMQFELLLCHAYTLSFEYTDYINCNL